MIKKINIGHLLRAFIRPTESFIYNQISTLSAYNPVTFCDHHFPGNNFSSISAISIDEIINPSQKLEHMLFYKMFRLLNNNIAKKLCEEIIKYDIKLLHFHYLVDARYFLPVIKLLKIPTIVSGYGWDVSSFPSKMFGFGKKYLNPIYKEVDIFLAMSEDMKMDMIKIGCPKNKIIVHYYGTNTKRFVHPERSYKNKKQFNLLFCGRLAHKKAPQLILYALRKLELSENSIPSWYLTFVGDGPLYGKLISIVNEFGWHDKVLFTGHIPHNTNELVVQYKNADIYLQPSMTTVEGEKEGIPGTLIEAMSSGLPVISTHHAGIPSVIENDINGFLCEEGDIDCIAEKIKILLEDSELRQKIGNNAAKKALTYLDLSNKTKELEEIYSRLLKSTN